MSKNFDTAQEMVFNDGHYRYETPMLRANAMATLALVEELRAAREPAKAQVVYALMMALNGGNDNVIDIYQDYEEANKEASIRNELASQLNNGASWHVRLYTLKGA